MAAAALALFVAYLLVAIGVRTWLQVRATGDTGFRGVSGRPGSRETFPEVTDVCERQRTRANRPPDLS